MRYWYYTINSKIFQALTFSLKMLYIAGRREKKVLLFKIKEKGE
jgi:hypothetical protein